MAVRSIIKQLAGAEDLLLGKGVEEQIRNKATFNITKLDILSQPDTIEELKLVDTTKYCRAMTIGRLTPNDGEGAFYYFDITDNITPESTELELPDVIIPESLIGRWKRVKLLVS